MRPIMSAATVTNNSKSKRLICEKINLARSIIAIIRNIESKQGCLKLGGRKRAVSKKRIN